STEAEGYLETMMQLLDMRRAEQNASAGTSSADITQAFADHLDALTSGISTAVEKGMKTNADDLAAGIAKGLQAGFGGARLEGGLPVAISLDMGEEMGTFVETVTAHVIMTLRNNPDLLRTRTGQ
ncbi:MAG: hypothetical protein JWO56_3755, partial [Acidobacteria bacterium]|nr:hypothetical protein [Acidobacteriota bacterium]